MKNDIFWSEIGSGFGELGGTPPKKNSQEYPPGDDYGVHVNTLQKTVFDQSCLTTHQKRSRSVRINKKNKLGQLQGLISLHQSSIRKITNLHKYLCITAMAEVTKYGAYT